MNRKLGQIQWASRSWRFLPVVLLVTGAVFLLPIVAVWQLRSHGTVTSLWLLIVIAVAISMALSSLLQAFWTRGPHQSELLFSELLIWGWIWHLRRERQLANAAGMLWRLDQDEASDGGRRPRPATRGERGRLVRELAEAVDAQDIYLHGHSRRVARHAEMIGRRLGLSSQQLARLRTGALAHDVGKLMLPRSVLDKPGALTEEEFELVKRHPDEGAKIVAGLGDREVTAIVRHHHERFDGRGYPAGLAGDEIPLGARIVAVADTFDAITSARPYRPAELHRQAIATLRECSGSQLDPEVVDAFLASYAGRRQALALAGLLAAPQQALARIGGGGSPRSTVANAAALAAVAAAVAAAAGGGGAGGGGQLSASVHKSGKSAVLGAHIRRSAHSANHHGQASGAASATGSPSSSGSGNKKSASSKSSSGSKPSSGSGGSGNGAGGRSPKHGGGGGSPSRQPSRGSGGNPGNGPTVIGTVPVSTGTATGTGTTSPTTPGSTGSSPPSTTGSGAPGTPGTTTSTTTSSPPQTSTTSSPPASGASVMPLAAGDTSCNGVYGGSGQHVTVPSGATCTLVSGSHVDDVTVQNGGVLNASGVTINHDLQSNGALAICGSTIEHDLHVENASSGGPITIGGSCGGDTIGHDLQVQNNAVPVTVEANHIGHDLHVQNNRAGSVVSGNTVGHDAHCEGDAPPVTGSGNAAGHDQDCPA